MRNACLVFVAVCTSLALTAGVVPAQTISPQAMALDQIAAQSATPMSHDETLKFVSGGW